MSYVIRLKLKKYKNNNYFNKLKTLLYNLKSRVMNKQLNLKLLSYVTEVVNYLAKNKITKFGLFNIVMHKFNDENAKNE